MGSPVIPVVTCIFMTKIEKDALDMFSTPQSVWYRFVDDVFTIVKKTAVKTSTI